MAIYEYKCHDCGAVFTERRAVKERDSETECPKCDSKNVKRELSKGTLFDLKGRGYYKPGLQ